MSQNPRVKSKAGTIAKPEAEESRPPFVVPGKRFAGSQSSLVSRKQDLPVDRKGTTKTHSKPPKFTKGTKQDPVVDEPGEFEPEYIEPRFFRTTRRQEPPVQKKVTEEEKAPKDEEDVGSLKGRVFMSDNLDPEDECPTGEGPIDNLHTEFSYYSSVLKELTPTLTGCKTKRRIFEWIDKLYQPPYFTSPLILKRNLYLSQLVLTCINDELYGVFTRSPPEQVLPPVNTWCVGRIPMARWERNTFWDDLYNAAVDEIDDSNHHILLCNIHGYDCEGESDNDRNEKAAGELLDQEFKFFLYIIQPYLTLVEDKKAKLKIALWLQLLSRVQTCSCIAMKGIRNDYMQALIGYVQDLRIVGPFNQIPEEDVLVPLSEAVDQLEESFQTFATPSWNEADDFLSMQPNPKNGAFCYLAVSGELEQPPNMTKTENKENMFKPATSNCQIPVFF